MGVATIIGLILGGLAGFFGDDQLHVTKTQLALNIIGFILAIFYGFGVRSYVISEGNFVKEIFVGLLIFVGVMTLANLLANGLNRIFPARKKLALAIDILVMRLIEIFNSIPGLILILALVAVIEKASIVNVMVIIGLISWTGIARFVRSELLRVRALDYVEAARSLGISDWRILMKHAIPNSLTPVLISIAFGMAGAILVEATLSFLGVGMPAGRSFLGKDSLSFQKQYQFLVASYNSWTGYLFNSNHFQPYRRRSDRCFKSQNLEKIVLKYYLKQQKILYLRWNTGFKGEQYTKSELDYPLFFFFFMFLGKRLDLPRFVERLPFRSDLV